MNHIGIGMNGIGASAEQGVRVDKAHWTSSWAVAVLDRHADKAQAMSSKHNIRQLGHFSSCGTGFDYQLGAKRGPTNHY